LERLNDIIYKQSDEYREKCRIKRQETFNNVMDLLELVTNKVNQLEKRVGIE